ncbi:hypothetical protein [Deinococcus marmoris]|uniref:Uncharacterized protein n=1 Tax=Deinococcus marmoris TaxID=249408 RepID=A0A1U7NTF1_9DEIO|nr:hypothetical protein [Deinococcus marmoris]OLV16203.1 hypothetical protein BOO71_0012457 [Deinococcus marmoris]
MGKVPVRKFTYLDYEIEIIRERRNLPPISKFEPRLGIEVRYGLKFGGQMTDWSEFVEATNDEVSANSLVEIGLWRARELRKKAASVVSPAA